MSDADPDEPVEETRLSPMAFPPVFRPQPRVEWTDAAGHHAKVIDGRVIVGSATGSGLVVQDPTVSRVHAEFDRPKLPHRSFMPELKRSGEQEPLR